MKLLQLTRPPSKPSRTLFSPSTSSAANPRHPSPLEIIEILEHVLSYLDQHTLVFSVRLVCAQWYTLSQHLIRRTVDLDMALDKNKRDEIVRMLVPNATCIVLSSSVEFSPQGIVHELTRLPPVLQKKNPSPPGQRRRLSLAGGPLTKMNKDGIVQEWVPLQELVVGRGFLWMPNLLAVLPSSTWLTRLQIHTADYGNPRIALGVLFSSYPNLVSLRIASPGFGSFVILDPSTDFFAKDGLVVPALPMLHKLEALTLNGVAIDQLNLERLLSHTPSLKRLRLWRLERRITPSPILGTQSEASFSTAIEVDEFLVFLRGLDLSLKLFSLSLEHTLLRPNQVRTLLCDFQPTVREWGFSTDVCASLNQIPNRITTLELVSFQWSFDERIRQAEGLHLFLCSSPLLLHLRAGEVSYGVDFMDLHTVNTRRPRHKNGAPMTWACRGLKTLHLNLSGSQESWEFGQLEARRAFGYIARFCPRLQDCDLGELYQFDFGLDCGFALMARLKELERVVLYAKHSVKLTKVMDRVWSVIQPSAIRQMQKKHTVFKWKTTIREELLKIEDGGEGGWQGNWNMDKSGQADGQHTNDPYHVHSPPGQPKRRNHKPENVEGTEAWKDPRLIGTLADVKAVLEEMEEDHELERFWPRLCFVHVRRSYRNHRRTLTRTIHSRRPLGFSDRVSDSLVVEDSPIAR